MVNAPIPALFEGLVDGASLPIGVAGHLGHGEAKGLLVEAVGERAASPVSSTIWLQSASKVRRHSGWSKARNSALLPQYRQVPVAVLSGFESGIASSGPGLGLSLPLSDC